MPTIHPALACCRRRRRPRRTIPISTTRSRRRRSGRIRTPPQPITSGTAIPFLATIDQPLYNGAATGSPITRYIHPDHLGSTNVVTDASGTVAQLLDYYPYGATRISSNTYPTNEKRQYIGQYSDTGTGLSYLNARYYDPQHGTIYISRPGLLGQAKSHRPAKSQRLFVCAR